VLEQRGDLEQVCSYCCRAVVQDCTVPATSWMELSWLLGGAPEPVREGSATVGADEIGALEVSPPLAPAPDDPSEAPLGLWRRTARRRLAWFWGGGCGSN
jgi:hypothetical protein